MTTLTSTLKTLLHALWLLLTLLLATALLLFIPSLFVTLYKIVLTSGAPAEDARLIASTLWNEDPFGQLTLKTGTLGAREVHHFNDIRHILRKILILLAFIAPPLLIFYKTIIWKSTARAALLILGTTGITLVVWALIAWRHLFRTLHWWLFQNDSWILPSGCTTLKLFPYALWQALGALILLLPLTILITIAYHPLNKLQLFKKEN